MNYKNRRSTNISLELYYLENGCRHNRSMVCDTFIRENEATGPMRMHHFDVHLKVVQTLANSAFHSTSLSLFISQWEREREREREEGERVNYFCFVLQIHFIIANAYTGSTFSSLLFRIQILFLNNITFITNKGLDGI